MPAKNSPIDLDSLEMDDLVAIGSALTTANSAFYIAGTPATLVPEGWNLALHPDLRALPARVKGTATLHTLADYIAYISQYANAASRTFVDQSSGQFQTVIDYHRCADGVCQPNWGGWLAAYKAPYSTEFLTWQAHSAKAMTQEAFAQFIEDNLPDIVDPAAAEMAEIARSLSANISVKFAKAIRLDNGETQLQYQEEIGGAAGVKGQLKIPQTIKLGLPLFVGGESYAVEARFRYRIKDGQLSMWYELIRPERLLRDAIDTMVQTVRDSTSIPVYYGTP